MTKFLYSDVFFHCGYLRPCFESKVYSQGAHMPTGTCGNCKKQNCGKSHCPCGRVHYCDKICQREHWHTTHVKYCLDRYPDCQGVTMVSRITCEEMDAFPDVPVNSDRPYKKKLVMIPDGSEIIISVPKTCGAKGSMQPLLSTHTPPYGVTKAVSSFSCSDSDGMHSLTVTVCNSHDTSTVVEMHGGAIPGCLAAFDSFVNP
jgi:hypothetical protein